MAEEIEHLSTEEIEHLSPEEIVNLTAAERHWRWRWREAARPADVVDEAALKKQHADKVEAFLQLGNSGGCFDYRAKQAFRKASPQIQAQVIATGDFEGARDASAALMARISRARFGGKIELDEMGKDFWQRKELMDEAADAIRLAFAPALDIEPSLCVDEIIFKLMPKIRKNSQKYSKDDRAADGGSSTKAQALVEEFVEVMVSSMMHPYSDTPWVSAVMWDVPILIITMHTFQHSKVFNRMLTPMLRGCIQDCLERLTEEERLKEALRECIVMSGVIDTYRKKATEHFINAYDDAHLHAPYGTSVADTEGLAMLQDFVRGWMFEFVTRAWDVLEHGCIASSKEEQVSFVTLLFQNSFDLLCVPLEIQKKVDSMPTYPWSFIAETADTIVTEVGEQPAGDRGRTHRRTRINLLNWNSVNGTRGSSDKESASSDASKMLAHVVSSSSAAKKLELESTKKDENGMVSLKPGSLDALLASALRDSEADTIAGDGKFGRKPKEDKPSTWNDVNCGISLAANDLDSAVRLACEGDTEGNPKKHKRYKNGDAPTEEVAIRIEATVLDSAVRSALEPGVQDQSEQPDQQNQNQNQPDQQNQNQKLSFYAIKRLERKHREHYGFRPGPMALSLTTRRTATSTSAPTSTSDRAALKTTKAERRDPQALSQRGQGRVGLRSRLADLRKREEERKERMSSAVSSSSRPHIRSSNDADENAPEVLDHGKNSSTPTGSSVSPNVGSSSYGGNKKYVYSKLSGHHRDKATEVRKCDDERTSRMYDKVRGPRQRAHERTNRSTFAVSSSAKTIRSVGVASENLTERRDRPKRRIPPAPLTSTTDYRVLNGGGDRATELRMRDHERKKRTARADSRSSGHRGEKTKRRARLTRRRSISPNRSTRRSPTRDIDVDRKLRRELEHAHRALAHTSPSPRRHRHLRVQESSSTSLKAKPRIEMLAEPACDTKRRRRLPLLT